MTSIKLKFRPSANGNGGSLYYQIIHQRVVRQIGTDYHIPQSAWNEKSGCVIGWKIRGELTPRAKCD
jgi:hypothetical protein